MHHRHFPHGVRAFTPCLVWVAFPPCGADAVKVTRVLWSRGHAAGAPGEER
ncbi:hypothetical protein ACFVTC_36970 [Streptomyces sp. NPDC057950]|uniref:hypothetical protein n=1 Tax=Streptomyces sp. NPDC057950 TaxID=3346288 RepID=UPI0036DFCE31